MKIIKFIPWDKQYPLLPPIKTPIPQWWKDGESFLKDENGNPDGGGLKSCIPFMEIMNTGYTIVSPFDIYVSKNKDGDLDIRWASPDSGEWPMFIQERPKDLGATIPRPAGHYPNHFVWHCMWSWKTPRKYSTIVTHPFNRFDLPFTTLSAIVDSDKFQGNGNIPFFFKEDFEGIIKAGTPIIQIYPFKRTSWKSWKDDSFNMDIQEKQLKDIRTNPKKSYKKAFWIRKEFK